MYKKLKRDVYNEFITRGKYPDRIVISRSMLTELEKSGYIGTESHDLSARTLMGMKMELNEEIDGYEIL